jgi:GTP-dependent phosphoenolpyruvate carboxykinase
MACCRSWATLGDYFAHWNQRGKNADESKLRRCLFNWFRRGDDAAPVAGLRRNSGCLKWAWAHEHKADGKCTPIASCPAATWTCPAWTWLRQTSWALAVKVDSGQANAVIEEWLSSSARSATASRTVRTPSRRGWRRA